MNTLRIVYLLSSSVFFPRNFRSFISHCFVLLLIIIFYFVGPLGQQIKRVIRAFKLTLYTRERLHTEQKETTGPS